MYLKGRCPVAFFCGFGGLNLLQWDHFEIDCVKMSLQYAHNMLIL